MLTETPSSTDATQSLLVTMSRDRSGAALQLASMTRAEQVQLVRSLPVSNRYDVITLLDDCAPLVRELGPAEVYSLAHEHGLEQSGAVLASTSPDQLKGIMDLGCWRGDSLDRDQAMDWLGWLLTLPDNEFRERVLALDATLLATVIGPDVVVGSDENAFSSARAPSAFTPESIERGISPGMFSYHSESAERMVHRLYEVADEVYTTVLTLMCSDDWSDQGATASTLQACLSEAEAKRSDRLERANLPDELGARVRLLRPLVVPRQRSFNRGTTLPSVRVRISLLERIREFTPFDESLTQWSEQLADVATGVVQIRGGDPGDPRVLASALRKATAYVSVGLDLASGGSVAFAAVLADTWQWSDLYRAGYTYIKPVKERAEAIGPERLLKGDRALWCGGLLEEPMHVYEPAADNYRLPVCTADIDVVARMLGM